jgi:hypothetical protein
MHRLNYIIGLTALVIVLGGCQKDLNRVPTNAITADVAYATPEGYKQVLAKMYGAFALTGNSGPDATVGDIAGIDQGSSDFLRLFWNLQELTTDEAAIVWNDPGLQDFHIMNWTSTNILIRGLYSRSLYHITACNEFIRESTDAKLSSRNITGAEADNIRHYQAEVRFLRAYEYWVLLDMFGNPPFVTENDPIGGQFIPKQIKRADLFAYIETELKAIEPLLVDARQNEYGRVDKAAANALLARLYLNAEVYTGQGRYTDAAATAQKVISSGYSLNSSYANLFLGDNNLNNPETILALNYDGVNTQSYGGTTYLINAAINAALDPKKFGVPNGGWGGMRSTKNLPLLFADYSGATDKRAMFAGSNIEMTDLTVYTDGLAVTKFKNITSSGATPASANGVYASTDFPLFRLAEMYLIYAEAVKRGGTGSDQTAIGYLNLLRVRAYGNTSGNISSFSLNDVLDERGRELYWEGFRRSDLIRYGRFTGDNYLWPWKGGVKGGRGVEPYRALFPLPSSDIISNPNLVQNTGY